MNMTDNTLTLNGTTLTVTRRDSFDIDIIKLADAYEDVMIDEFYNVLTQRLCLDEDISDYIENDSKLRNKILYHVKSEMFKRGDKKLLTF
jgi:hypothetical protein